MTAVLPPMLVSLAQACTHLRLSTEGLDDGDLALKVKAASRLIVQYVDTGMAQFKDSAGDFVAPYADSSGTFLPPFEMQAATLLMVGYLWEQRDEDGTQEFADGRLPRPVRSMLNGLRVPTL